MAVLSVVLRGFWSMEQLKFIPGLQLVTVAGLGNWNTVRIVQSSPVGTVLGPILPSQINPSNLTQLQFMTETPFPCPRPNLWYPEICNPQAKHPAAMCYATVLVVSAAASAACAAPASSASRLRKLR